MAGGNTSTGDEHKARVATAVTTLGVKPRSTSYGTVYGGSKKATEFTFRGKHYLVVSVWQGVPGTVDEKFPFLFENVSHNSKYEAVLLVIGGDGTSIGAMHWLSSTVERWTNGGSKPLVYLFHSADEFRGTCQRWAAHPDRTLVEAIG